MMDGIFVIEEIAYKIVNNKPVVMLFSRNYRDRNDFYVYEWKGTRPYFFCPSDETNVELPNGCVYDENVKDAYGRDVTKVYTQIPSDVPKMRDLYSYTDMADILFEKRCLVDHGLKYAYTWDGKEPHPIDVDGILEPRIVYFDIEVLSPNGIFPKPEDSKYPVVSIQVMDSYTEKIIVFTNGIPQQEDTEHFACKDEKTLFKMFLEYIKSVNPDVITAWNGEQYDIPYLIRRSWQLGININDLARYGKVSCEYNPDTGKFNTKIKGRSTLDMLLAFKKYYIMKAQRESYSLKSVSADYGFEYFDWGPYLEKLLSVDKNYVDFIQYCKNDVIALRNIDKRTNLFDFYENLRKITGTRLDDVLYNSKLIEMYLLHEQIAPMPTKTKVITNPDDKYEGALVLMPPPGIHEWVGCVDLAALYPSIMRAFPERTCPDVNLKVIDVLNKIVNKREEYRTMRKNGNKDPGVKTKEEVYKTLANSVYGVLGAKTFRLYKRECAESVTAIGREINIYIHDTLKALNYSVLYSDTDSSFFSKIETVEQGLKIQDHLNNVLIEWGKLHDAKIIFSLKLEKIYRRIMFKSDKTGDGVKKKYCGYLIWEEGDVKNELNYKGLELKRSDQAEITRDCLHYFLEKSLIDGNIDDAVAYVKKIYNDVKSGNVNIFNISLPKAIRKVKYNTDNAWVRGMNRASADYNYLIQEGVKPRLIYLRNGEICIDEDFDVSLIKDLIDYNVMAEKVIKNKMESYMWSIGYDWDTVVHGQCSLDAWF